jgi:mono/diheme cytochrome c family protein
MLQLTRTMGLIAALVFTAGMALARDDRAELDFGKYEYQKHCAACHGRAGKGDGVQKPYLHQAPSDLTTLSKRNRGAFPSGRVYEKIDGTREVEHARREMPCWRAEYGAEAAAAYAEEARRDISYSTDLYVETRVAALVDHLRDLQVK